MDYPVAGLVLYGLGAWGLLKEALAVEDAVRLLVLADLFAYSRYTLTMNPERTADGRRERRRPAWPPGSARSTARARARTSCRRPGPSPKRWSDYYILRL